LLCMLRGSASCRPNKREDYGTRLEAAAEVRDADGEESAGSRPWREEPPTGLPRTSVVRVQHGGSCVGCSSCETGGKAHRGRTLDRGLAKNTIRSEQGRRSELRQNRRRTTGATRY